MPTQVSYYISEDNINYSLLGEIKNTLDPKIEENTILEFPVKNISNKKARYVKVVAKNYGKLPTWHQGFPYDGDAFIFIDEIFVR